MKIITHNRLEYYAQTTIGIIIINGDKFCNTLEDTVRPHGIKVKGHTSIPDSDIFGYTVGIRYSAKFNREVLVLYTEEDEITLEHGGISFTYIYAHGGNTHEDTEGCILLGYNRMGNTIQGTAEQELFDIVKGWIDEGEEVRWLITNFKQIGQ